ncbi:MAG: creatininase family protein, partial [Chloroflexota bacterium]
MKPSRFYMPEMTWIEIGEARRFAPLAIIPAGSCEQHGPHLALETDSVRALEFSKRLAERLAPR